MKNIKALLILFFILNNVDLKSQCIDITPYVIFKEGCLIGLTEGLGDLPDTEPGVSLAEMVYDSAVCVPDSLDGMAVTVINDVFDNGYIRKIRLPEFLKYLHDSFDRNLEEVNIPPNLYYFYVGYFGTMDSIALPTPEKENHEFLGWKKFGVDSFFPGGSYVKSSSGHYYAYFKYLGEQPYIIGKEDVIFYDGELKDCYYRGAKNIILPSSFCGDSVKQIYGRAFRNQDFESVVFEKGFESIGGFGWNNISQIELPEGLIKIQKGAFESNKLFDVVIPTTVIRINPGAFSRNNIERLKFNLPANLSFVGGFLKNKISELELPSSLDTIGQGGFAYNYLKEVKVPENVKVIEAAAFFKNEIESIELPDALNFIGEEAFQHNAISEVIFPKNVKTLGERSFSDNKLRKVQLPKNLESIGASCFRNNQLSEVTIPSQVVYIGEYAFANNPFPKAPPRLPEPNIEGKNFLYWKGEVLSDSDKKKVEKSNPGDIIREEVRYTAVFEE